MLRAKLSPDLLALAEGSQSGSVNVIVRQEDSGRKPLLGSVLNLLGLADLVNDVGGRVTRHLVGLGAVSARMPVKSLRGLAARTGVRYISPDRALGADGHLETTTGTAGVRTQTTSSLLG